MNDTKEALQTLTDYVRQHEAIRQNIEMLNDRKTVIKNDIDALVETVGTTTAKGHIEVVINDSVSGIDKVTRQRRVSQTFSAQIAAEILEEKGLKDRCLTLVPVLDEQEVMLAYNEGLLTDDDIQKMFPEKVTWATIIK